MDSLIKDIRYSARSLLKRPAFAVIAILTLAIGIGANTAVFSVVNAMLFRPRPVFEPARLVELYVGDVNNPYHNCSYPDFVLFREQKQIFSGLAAYHVDQFKLGGAEDIEQVWGETVSGDYFAVLGVNPIIGRAFSPEEDRTPGTHPVAVVSHSLWQRRFGGNPAIVGQTINLNHQTLKVIGVAPPQYTGMIRGLSIDVWVPVMMAPQLDPQKGMAALNSRGSQWLFQVGRLAPGVSLAQAQAKFELLSRQLQEAYPDAWQERRDGSTEALRRFVTVLPESETRIHPQAHAAVYAGIALVMVMINLVLLVACMNLASLLLARASERGREIAVRLALGAGRRHIVRQLLTESVLIALAAGAGGTLLAVWLTNLAVAFIPVLPEGIRLAIDLQIDWRVLAYTFAFSFIVGVLFGLVPALQVSRPDLVETLKESSIGFAGSRSQSRLRNGLIVAQVAFALLLLVSAGLAVRSLRNISPTRLGFDSENLVVAPLRLEQQYDRARSQDFYQRLQERVSVLPGVRSVSFIHELPGGLLGSTRASVGIEGHSERTAIEYNTISAGYLSAMKIPIVQGRDFSEADRDGAPCVAIVNESFERRYFADGRALSKHLTRLLTEKETQRCEIVGVVRDNKVQSLQKDPSPWFAYPLQQTHSRTMTMLVQTDAAPGSIVPAVRRAIQSIDQTIPVADVLTLQDTFKPVLYIYRLFGLVIGGCGGLAVLLASLGIYGTVAYGVSQRTREIGIRVALGADRASILGLVIRQGMVRVICGLGAGLVLALVLTRVMASSVFELDLLFGVSTSDPLTYAVVGALMSLVTLIACYLPARRATKVDPLVALRYE